MVSLWFIPHGLQIVLYPWLLAVYLHLDPHLVGIGQMCLQLPGLFLALVAGSLLDRWDTRRMLSVAHLVAAIPPLVLALALWTDQVSFQLLLAFALVSGSCVAFANPARDAILASVAGRDVQRAVTSVTGVQFGVQIIGYGLAMTTEWIGPAALLLIQAMVMFSGVWVARCLPGRPLQVRHGSGWRGMYTNIKDGLRVARRTPAIFAVLLVSFCGSFTYLGAFFVLLPILIRDYYGGGAAEFGWVNIVFMLGTIGMTVAMLRAGGIRRRGRAYLLANLWGAGGALTVISFGVPFWAMLVMLAIWGAGAGIGMSMSRTILQEHAPEAYRARIFSIYQLAFMAGGPAGSLVMGYVVKLFGPLHAALLPPVVMLAVLTAVYWKTDLWRIGEPRPARTT